MKEALRLMSMPGELFFSAKGEWIHKLERDVKVTHPGVSLFFSKNLEFSSEHNSYIIRQNSVCVKVKIEDCPFILSHFETSETSWSWVLNSQVKRKLLNSDSLLIDSENQLYLEINGLAAKEGFTQVKLSRSAAQQVWSQIEEVTTKTTAEQIFFFCYKNMRIQIQSRT